MLHQIDFYEDVRQTIPTVPTTGHLCKFKVSGERHGAYESMWKAVTFLGVLANTAMWVYI